MNKRQRKKNMKRLKIWLYASVCLTYHIPTKMLMLDKYMCKQVDKLLRKTLRSKEL